jgi:hypothetical protein
MRSYTQLTREQRCQLSALLKIERSNTEITSLLHIYKSTVGAKINKTLGRKARVFYCHDISNSHIIHWTSSPMGFFGIQVSLLQVALQDTDPFVAHQLCQGEDVSPIPEHGKCKGTPEIMQ